jgi:hypothetical protein
MAVLLDAKGRIASEVVAGVSSLSLPVQEETEFGITLAAPP